MQCTWVAAAGEGCRGVSGSKARPAPGRGSGRAYRGLQRHPRLYSLPSVWCRAGTGSRELSSRTVEWPPLPSVPATTSPPGTPLYLMQFKPSQWTVALPGLELTVTWAALHLASVSQTRAGHFSDLGTAAGPDAGRYEGVG